MKCLPAILAAVVFLEGCGKEPNVVNPAFTKAEEKALANLRSAATAEELSQLRVVGTAAFNAVKRLNSARLEASWCEARFKNAQKHRNSLKGLYNHVVASARNAQAKSALETAEREYKALRAAEDAERHRVAKAILQRM